MRPRPSPASSVSPARGSTALVVLDQATGWLREDGPDVLGLDLAPGVAGALRALKEAGLRIVVLAPERSSGDATKLLAQYLPDADEVTARPPGRAALVVAADRVARARLLSAGGQGFPHAAIAALAVAEGGVGLHRVTGARSLLERLRGAVPYSVERMEDGTWAMLAALSPGAAKRAADAGAGVQPLPLDLATEDPLFVRIDGAGRDAEREMEDLKVLFREEGRVLVALGPDRFSDSLPFHGIHGHFLAPVPQPDLLRQYWAPDGGARIAESVMRHLPLEELEISARVRDLIRTILFRCPNSAADFQATVDRYSGAADLDAAGPVASRHIRHPDNPRVVQALLDDLGAIGYCAYTHSFSHAGLTLSNVVADLPGSGLFRLEPAILEKLREVLVRHPFPDPPGPWLGGVEKLLGRKWVEANLYDDLSSLEGRWGLERLLELRPWWPWWRRLCPLAGPGAELVIVGCHLDSTASRASGYDPVADPAPGADDDASGIAATLALARHLWRLRGKLRHTVRFCFFNAEEQGLVGSKAYAAMLAAAGAPVRAVVCADMIGHDSDAQRLFEVHAGYSDPAVRDASVPIADTIAAWAAFLGALPPAQVYRGTSGAAGSDRNLFDGAINRSDHAAFHQNGFPAVVVSEDFFVNLAAEPGSDPNPNYHDSDDLTIDAGYAADITCALAHAVRDLAG